MRLVIDTNIIIYALIKPSLTRKIIIEAGLEILTPDTLSEILKYKHEIMKKARISEEEFNILIETLFKYIRVVNPDFYKPFINQADKLIKDKDDVPFLACALAFNAIIWTEDKHFKNQNKIKVITTNDLLKDLE